MCYSAAIHESKPFMILSWEVMIKIRCSPLQENKKLHSWFYSSLTLLQAVGIMGFQTLRVRDKRIPSVPCRDQLNMSILTHTLPGFMTSGSNTVWKKPSLWPLMYDMTKSQLNTCWSVNDSSPTYPALDSTQQYLCHVDFNPKHFQKSLICKYVVVNVRDLQTNLLSSLRY